MKTITTIKQIKKIVSSNKDKTIGFIPTMGYLHQGHVSLIKRARKENDIVLLSIYVNPTQFGATEDLKKYPRDIKRDTKIAKDNGVDIIFYPSNDQMYPLGYNTFVNVEALGDNLCGVSRPTHFRGVTTIVAKLFNILSATNAYFGQKDAQQAIIIKQMVKDLNMDVNIKICPIVREKDGLAMSSRNVYLSLKQREDALNIYRSLNELKDMHSKGEKYSLKLKTHVSRILNKNNIKIDYIKIVDINTLKDINLINRKALVAIACFIGKTRLIDNIILK